MFTPAIPKEPIAVEFHCHAGIDDLRYCSEFDKCLDNELKDHYANQNLTCQLTCQVKPFMWDIICNNWLNATDCSTPNTNTTVNIKTTVNMGHMNIEQSCMYFMIAHARGEINGRNVTMYCPKDKDYFNASCRMNCYDEFLDSKLGQSPVINNIDAMGLYQFWWFFIMLILSWIGMAAVVSIGDAICFAILGERAHLYGKQRLFGSVGWGIFSIIAGVLVDKMSQGVEKDYTIVFWMTMIIIALDVVASLKLRVSFMFHLIIEVIHKEAIIYNSELTIIRTENKTC